VICSKIDGAGSIACPVQAVLGHRVPESLLSPCPRLLSVCTKDSSLLSLELSLELPLELLLRSELLDESSEDSLPGFKQSSQLSKDSSAPGTVAGTSSKPTNR